MSEESPIVSTNSTTGYVNATFWLMLMLMLKLLLLFLLRSCLSSVSKVELDCLQYQTQLLSHPPPRTTAGAFLEKIIHSLEKEAELLLGLRQKREERRDERSKIEEGRE